jgi:ketosteroid isomerase-like protein
VKKLYLALMIAVLSWPFCLDVIHCQNIPPLIGDQVGKPRISVPNPLSQSGQQTAPNQSNSTSAQDIEIHTFLDTFVKNVADKDLDKIGGSYAQQPEPVVYWESHEFRGWEAIQAQWQKALAEGAVKLTLNDMSIHIFGRFAWVTAGYRRENLRNGKSDVQMGHLTLVLEKKRTQWMILHEHLSPTTGKV